MGEGPIEGLSDISHSVHAHRKTLEHVAVRERRGWLCYYSYGLDWKIGDAVGLEQNRVLIMKTIKKS